MQKKRIKKFATHSIFAVLHTWSELSESPVTELHLPFLRKAIGLCATHNSLQLLNRNGDLLLATNHAVARLGNDQVILDADTAEVVVGSKAVVIDNAVVFPLALALLDQRRDKVDTRLVKELE